MTGNELKLFIENDKEWKKRFDEKQEIIFNEIKEIRKDSATKQILCENRFTKLEGSTKIHGTVFGMIGSGILIFLKWFIGK